MGSEMCIRDRSIRDYVKPTGISKSNRNPAQTMGSFEIAEGGDLLICNAESVSFNRVRWGTMSHCTLLNGLVLLYISSSANSLPERLRNASLVTTPSLVPDARRNRRKITLKLREYKTWHLRFVLCTGCPSRMRHALERAAP